MYLAIDIIICVVLLATVLSAWKRGFIRTVFQLCSTVISVLLAIFFHEQLGAFFYDSFVYGALAPHIESLTGQIITAVGGSLDFNALAEKLPENIVTLAETFNIDLAAFLEDAVQSVNAGGESFAEVGRELAVTLSTSAANILAFAAIFFGGMILLSVACFILDKVADLPVLHGVNRFLGFALGVLEAAILGIVLSKLAATVCSVYASIASDFAFGDVANGTYIAKFFLDISPW